MRRCRCLANKFSGLIAAPDVGCEICDIFASFICISEGNISINLVLKMEEPKNGIQANC
jgi:hypothetical protein